MSKLDSLATVAALETLLALTPEQRAQVLAELPETKPITHEWHWLHGREPVKTCEHCGISWNTLHFDPRHLPPCHRALDTLARMQARTRMAEGLLLQIARSWPDDSSWVSLLGEWKERYERAIAEEAKASGGGT